MYIFNVLLLCVHSFTCGAMGFTKSCWYSWRSYQWQLYSVTAYPRPYVLVITPYGCDSQQESIPIGKHTNKVVVTIYNAAKSCEEMYQNLVSSTIRVIDKW